MQDCTGIIDTQRRIQAKPHRISFMGRVLAKPRCRLSRPDRPLASKSQDPERFLTTGSCILNARGGAQLLHPHEDQQCAGQQRHRPFFFALLHINDFQIDRDQSDMIYLAKNDYRPSSSLSSCMRCCFFDAQTLPQFADRCVLAGSGRSNAFPLLSPTERRFRERKLIFLNNTLQSSQQSVHHHKPRHQIVCAYDVIGQRRQAQPDTKARSLFKQAGITTRLKFRWPMGLFGTDTPTR